MSYRIEIVEVTSRPITGRSWNKLHDDSKRDGQYGYVEFPSVERTERELLKMETDTLDVPAVIKAVLGL